MFEEAEDAANKSYFSEIIASVSDIEFTRDGRYIVARDYLSLKVRALPGACWMNALHAPFAMCVSTTAPPAIHS